jgi:hypothetical protein
VAVIGEPDLAWLALPVVDPVTGTGTGTEIGMLTVPGVGKLIATVTVTVIANENGIEIETTTGNSPDSPVVAVHHLHAEVVDSVGVEEVVVEIGSVTLESSRGIEIVIATATAVLVLTEGRGEEEPEEEIKDIGMPEDQLVLCRDRDPVLDHRGPGPGLLVPDQGRWEGIVRGA